MNEQDTSLVTLHAETAFEVFTIEGGIDPYLESIETHIKKAVLPSVDTAKGRKEIKALAYKVTRSKTYLDGIGKDLTTKQKEIPAKIDATRKRMRDKLDQWASEIRAPVDEWEDVEKARKQKHLDQITRFNVSNLPADLSSTDLASKRNELSAITVGPDFEEYENEAVLAKSGAIERLNTLIEERRKHESDQAELAALRAEKEKQQAADRDADLVAAAADRARKEAEAKAEKERQKLIEAKEKAEANAKALAQREREVAQEKAARESNLAHRRKINATARDALVSAGIDHDTATNIITLIASNNVPNVTINY